jgi:hypothetical protein
MALVHLGSLQKAECQSKYILEIGAMELEGEESPIEDFLYTET